MLVFAGGALALAGVMVGLVLWSQRAVPVGRVDGKLRPCPSSPNCVCSEEGEGPGSIRPFEIGSRPEADLTWLRDRLSELPGAEILTHEPDYVHAVVRTRWLRFADDVELRLDRPGEAIHVRSASRVGHSDLGANRRRIEALRELFRARRD